jgi:hypothetical protein
MFDPLDFKNRPLAEKLQRKRRLAALVIMSERLTLRLWRSVTWFLFFCGLWLFYIPPVFGQTGQIAALVIFIGGLGYFFYKDVLRLRFPSAKDVDRRIEQDSKLKHRPLSSLKDELANPLKADTRSLWERAREQLIAVLPRLKVGFPAAFMAKKDPYALRLAVILFFGLGLYIAGPAWKDRIHNGLTAITFESVTRAESISVWITPPPYTKVSQIVLKGDEKEKLSMPAGSNLKVRVHGGIGQPSLHIDDKTWPLTYAGEDNYTLEMTLPAGNMLKIKQMLLTRAAWNFEIAPDKPPVITVKGDPVPLPDGPLRFPLSVYDDYGVKNLTLKMSLDPEAGESPLGEPVTETRSVMSPPGTELAIQPVYDLTAHVWAGLPALFTFTVTDHTGKTQSAEPIKIILPERIFKHPIAKALISERKKLAWNPLDDYETIGREIESLLPRPQLYQNDIVVFLSIRSAASRLLHAEKPEAQTTRSVMDILWDTALRVEDGDLTLAARNLRNAQMALENALENPETGDADISKLMQELREAMAEYLMEMQREIQKQIAEGKPMPLIPPELLAQMIDPDALAGFLDQLEAEMRNGDRNKAQEMLSQLQRMMDMMDPSMAAPMPPDMQMMAEGVNELQELIDRQEDLLKQTKKQAEIFQTLDAYMRYYGEQLPEDKEVMKEWGLENMPPAPGQNTEEPLVPTINTETNKAEQEALRLILGQLMMEAGTVLPEIPENMTLAEQEMRGSSSALGANHPDTSIPHQEAALKYLKEAQQDLSQQMMARMQQMTGFQFSGSGMRYDPLGRPYGGEGDRNGMFPGSRVKIPNEAEKKKAQEILRLLRERSGEFDRPKEELEYYRRLLRQF